MARTTTLLAVVRRSRRPPRPVRTDTGRENQYGSLFRKEREQALSCVCCARAVNNVNLSGASDDDSSLVFSLSLSRRLDDSQV